MRGALLLLLASCADSSFGRTGPGGDIGAFCVPGAPDIGCAAGEVCARTGACYLAQDVRTVHVLWTLQGMPASAATCGPSPNLELYFMSNNPRYGSQFGFAPVPCVEGEFTVDELPVAFDSVLLGVAGDLSTGFVDDATGSATIDLRL